ncbi:MAG: DUF2231 domain-containing protein [Bacteroidota bacterium]|nr:DUF2231 domain-containing protein [Bacteroidota bacterium]
MFSTSHLHPLLVHFPIALVIIGFLAELAFLFFKKEASLNKMGYYLLIVGTLAAVVAWLSGNFFTSEMNGTAGKMRETHELFATITMGLLIATSGLRTIMLVLKNVDPRLKALAFVLYGLAAVTVSITGYLGGSLVYNYMLGL